MEKIQSTKNLFRGSGKNKPINGIDVNVNPI